MHVLQLGPYPPPEGGINRNILAIREELIARGDRCSVIATSKSTVITGEADVYHPRTAAAMLRLLVSLEFDILHLHVGGSVTPKVLSLIAACGVIGRGKNVFSLHSGGYPSTKAGLAAKKRSVRGSIFRRYSRLIAVNPLIAEVFRKYGIDEARIRVIYPFAFRLPDPRVEVPERLADFARLHSPFLLTVGLLEDEYDLFMQIDKMEAVLESFPDAGLMIVGSGSLERRLQDAIVSKTYSENIFLAGDVPHGVTLHLIDEADMLLRTTLYDGDAISVREALFLGTPVIATENGMRPEGVTVIPAGDSEALIREVLKWAPNEPKAPIRSADRSNILEVLDLYDEISAVRASAA